jgi:hypothetical protein
MIMMSGNRGEQNNDKEAWNQIDDDNNCEAVANTTNKNNEHDRNCVVEANTGDNEGVDIHDEGGKEMDNEFDYNDNYNEDDGRGGGSVVNNNTANLVTIASTLMDLSRGKEEESKRREETFDKIDDDGDLKPAAKPTDFILRHDKDSVNNNDEGGNGDDKEYDSLFNHNDDDTNIDREGGSGAASNNDTNMDSIDEERGERFADNNDGNNSTITKMGNNNSSTSPGSTNQK